MTMDCKFKLYVPTDAKRMAAALSKYPYSMEVRQGNYTCSPKNEVALSVVVGYKSTLTVNVTDKEEWQKILDDIQQWAVSPW